VSGIYGMANITNNLQSDKTKVDFETYKLLALGSLTMI